MQEKLTVDEFKAMYRQSEDSLQVACVRWFRYAYPKFRRRLIASLNGAPLQDGPKTWGKLKQMGAVEGEADLFFAVPSGDLSGLYIELKTKVGKQRQTQKEFEADVTEHYGYKICRTLEDFQDTIKRYLESGEYD